MKNYDETTVKCNYKVDKREQQKLKTPLHSKQVHSGVALSAKFTDTIFSKYIVNKSFEKFWSVHLVLKTNIKSIRTAPCGVAIVGI